ncbi:MAG: sugar ABC transporter ATP-binding protein [Treponema sp.]|nr:sugar ABC transporter ATP-binding protein [Treponema sp.]
MSTILSVEGISKHFVGVQALKGISVAFEKGEVHALCGENGAGKSTLIKTITGALSPDSGRILLNGEELRQGDPQYIISQGISAIYQEFNLIPSLTVADNIFFGREQTRGIFLSKQEMERQTEKICKDMGVDIPPNMRIMDLGVAYQQIVEIAKTISKKCSILIMDEPTAPLTEKEIGMLFRVIKSLKASGVTIIYISHRLEEIFEICDRITVLRDGEWISTMNVSETNKTDLIQKMVGRELNSSSSYVPQYTDEVVLELRNFRTSLLKDVSFSLHRGEILGMGGLVGAGRTETVMALFGASPLLSGEVLLHGKPIHIRSPQDAIANGLGLLSEDRKKYGLILRMPIQYSITLPILNRLSRFSFIQQQKEVALCEVYQRELRIKAPSIKQPVINLSGGNQQKVILAKWLATDSEILIFDEPTRGIDVGAKQEIYQIMRKLVQEGKSIIMISSEMIELLEMSDRLIVMHEGKVQKDLNREEFSQETVLRLASGE